MPLRLRECLKTDLPSAHFDDNAVLVLQARRSSATGNRNTRSDCRIRTDDVDARRRLTARPTTSAVAAPNVPTLNPPTLSG